MQIMHPAILAQATRPSTQPFIEQVLHNDTLRHTTLAGWITLLAGGLGGILLGKLVQALLHRASRSVADRWPIRGIFLKSLAGPLNLAIIGIGLAIGLTELAPSDQLQFLARKGFAAIYLSTFGWLAYNTVDIIERLLTDLTARTATKLDDQLVRLLRKTLRIILVVILALFAAENLFDANISAWLAGLGIAGLAVSLAAQDSIKNVFGSVTILFDQPFNQGDVVTFEGTTGTIEELGFRSTRIRTLAGSLLTVPNSKISDNVVENLSARRSIRRVIDVTIPYDTPLPKVRQATEIIRQILAEPDIAAAFTIPGEQPQVFFTDLNPSSLNIRVFYWFAPAADYFGFLAHSQQFNLRLMERFEQAGIQFAFPTQTLHLAGDPARSLALQLHNASATPPPENCG